MSVIIRNYKIMVSRISAVAFALIGESEAAVYNLITNTAKAELESKGLTIAEGETATFILKQNLTTGYGWEINESIANGIYSVTSKDNAPVFTGGLLGVPGTKEITIKALMQGYATLQAAYVRPWEFYGWD